MATFAGVTPGFLRWNDILNYWVVVIGSEDAPWAVNDVFDTDHLQSQLTALVGPVRITRERYGRSLEIRGMRNGRSGQGTLIAFLRQHYPTHPRLKTRFDWRPGTDITD